MCAVANIPIITPTDDADVDCGQPGFVGYDKDGHFLHYCHCGKWGAFGYNVHMRKGQLEQWYCREHRP